MANDGHGMPVPSDESPLPWKWIKSPDFPRATMILSGSLDLGEVGEIYVNDDDDKYVQHAVNNIIKCRDIVRRLAEPQSMSLNEMEIIIQDAVKLWDKMQEEAKGGDGGHD